MSICDSCRDPGACCKGFTINREFPYFMPANEVEKHIHNGTDPWDSTSAKNHPKHPYFYPIHRNWLYCFKGQQKPHSARWTFNCTRLIQGRCTKYDERPEICKNYEPKHDLLCIEYDGSFKGRLTHYKKEKVD